MAARTRLTELDRRWHGVVYGPLAWAFFVVGVALFAAVAVLPQGTFAAQRWLAVWFSAFVLWFASTSLLTGARAAAERDVWPAVVSGGWGLLLCVLGVSVAIAAARMND